MGQVAIYCRVSTDDQCCERQERDPRAFARRAGHCIVGAFKKTASGARNDRPERKKVIALAQAREIDAIPRHRAVAMGSQYPGPRANPR
jgi:putative DNA-invertase from lambdoid prophage Rac